MKQYLTLKNYTIAMAVLLVSMVSIHYIANRPQSVNLTSDRWKCNGTMPVGIEAHCTSYVYIPTINEQLSMKSQ